MNRIGEGEGERKREWGDQCRPETLLPQHGDSIQKYSRERKACKGRRLGGEENTKTYVSQTNGMERSKKQTREEENDIITQVLFPPRQLYEWQWIASGH